MRHPHLNEHGQPVTIHLPSLPTPLAAWGDPAAIATVVPGGAMPEQLNGIRFTPWQGVPAPSSLADEPPFIVPAGLAAASGVVVVEDDGRVWLVAPTNRFGGYDATFPKGRLDAGASLQQTAIREAFEESGLVVDIGAWLLDVRRTLTFTRYYLARRIGGNPASMGWETQAVHLVPLVQLPAVATHPNDARIIQALEGVTRETKGSR